MLEELQTKMKELVTKCRLKFGNEVKEIAEELGLKDAMKEPTVFERLYEDASSRIHRLEKLREKYNAEKKHMYQSGEGSPRAAALGQPAVSMMKGSVLEAVENSQLTGLQSLVKDRDAPPSQPPPTQPPPSQPPPSQPLRKSTWLLPPITQCGSDVETSAGTTSRSSSTWRTISRVVTPMPDSKGVSTCSLEFGAGLGGESGDSRLPFGGTARRLPPVARRL